MKLSSYLSKFKNSTELTIIGPLFKRGSFDFNEPIVFIDGGSEFQEESGFSVGDGDSSSKQLDEVLPVEKNYSDLEYALKFISSNFQKINAYGFLGGRRDHEMANIFAFHELQKSTAAVVELSNDFHLLPAGKHCFDISANFSLMPSSIGSLKISGKCKYEFDGEVKTIYSSHFISNIGQGMVEIVNSMPLGLYQFNSDL